MNEDVKNIFEKYTLVLEQENIKNPNQKPLGQLVGAKGGGEGGDWGGSLPKLISLLPFGVWKPSSLKRSRQSTRSGFMSDHYEGNQIAYAADFGLNSTFGSRVEDATRFAIAVARNAGKNIDSWEQFKGNSFNHNTPDGYRVQIIWLSNVGGNHYDHVHVGVRKGVGAIPYRNQEDNAQDTDNSSEQKNGSNKPVVQAKGQVAKDQEKEEQNPFMKTISDIYSQGKDGITKELAKQAYDKASGFAKNLLSQYGSRLS